jgi:hypothetical protein
MESDDSSELMLGNTSLSVQGSAKAHFFGHIPLQSVPWIPSSSIRVHEAYTLGATLFSNVDDPPLKR